MFDLDPSENVILKVRRHKLALFFQTFFLIFFIILPPILFWVSERAVLIRGNDLALFLSVYSGILLIAWMMFFMIWTNYYLDVLIVTDKKIIDIQQKGFFRREISTVGLENIQDITVNINGVLATLLDYGTLLIQTAAESNEFIIRDIPEPNKVKSIIYELRNKQLEAPKSVKMLQLDHP